MTLHTDNLVKQRSIFVGFIIVEVPLARSCVHCMHRLHGSTCGNFVALPVPVLLKTGYQRSRTHQASQLSQTSAIALQASDATTKF